MSDSNTRKSGTDLKKWIYFLLFLTVVALVAILMMGTGGKEKARDLYQQASAKTKEAVRVAEQTSEPQDRANADIATESLEKAESALVENDFGTAIQESEKALLHANKVLANNAAVASEGGQILIRHVVGDVTMRSNGPTFDAVLERQPLAYGSTIEVGSQSGVMLGYASLVEMTLHPNSRLTLQERLDVAGERVFMSLFLEQGRMSIKTTELKGLGKIYVNSNLVRAEIFHNTEGVLALDASGSQLVMKVSQGLFQVTQGSRSASVNRNQMLQVVKDQPLPETVTIPIAPMLVKPENFARFAINQNGFANVEFAWEAVAEARSYNVEISENRLFTANVREKNGYVGTNMDLRDLREGNYFWRVASVDGRGNLGLPSPGRQFQIGGVAMSSEGAVDSTPPTLNIKSKDVQGYLVIIKGETERDAEVRVDGERAIMDEFTGQFTYVASKPGRGRYSINVVATDRAGNSVSHKFTVEIRD